MCGHHPPTPGQCVRVSPCGDELAQPLRARLGGLGDPGRGVLRQCPGEGPAPSWAPGDYQGAQFTGKALTGVLQATDVRISTDGKGRALDKIKVERLWSPVKYEETYLKDYEGGAELVTALRAYFDLQNHERPHQSHGGLTPAQVYHGASALALAA